MMISFIVISLTACSGGGGSSAAPSKAVLTLSTSGTLSPGTTIGGIQVDVDLPLGVTAKASGATANPSVMETDSGVVTAAGAAAGADFVHGMYMAGATPTVYRVNANVLKSAGGFTTGDFAKVSCGFVGQNPVVTDFHTANFKAVDLNGTAIAGLTVSVALSIQ